MASITLPSITQPSITQSKIIRVCNYTVRDNRVLFWAKSQLIEKASWNRWDAIVTSIDDYKRWSIHTNITNVILQTISDEDIDYIENELGHKNINVYISEQALSVRPHSFWLNVSNTYLLEDMEVRHSFIQPVWDGTVEDAVACIATIHRYFTLVDWNGSIIRRSYLESIGMTIKTDICPPEVWLLTQYFVHSSGKRAREIKKSLMNNCDNKYIDRILLLTEKNLSSEWASMRGNSKISQIVVGHRLTYGDFLKATVESVPSNVITVYANADIYLNHTIRDVYDINMADKMLALLRWDETESGLTLFGPHPDSQDTWIVLSDSIKSRTWNYADFGYELGKAGCDNRFTFDMFRNRFLICNPAETIQTIHLHTTNIRNYNKYDIVPSTHYVYSSSGPLLAFNQKRYPGDKIGILKYQPFDINIQCLNQKHGATWCTMLARKEQYNWTYNKSTQWSKDLPIYEWTNAFIMNSGLVFDIQNVYVGQDITEFAKDATTLIDVNYTSTKDTYDEFLVIPVKDRQIYDNLDLFILKYISKVYTLLETNPNGFFWLPEAHISTLGKFRTSTGKIHAIPWDYNSSVYAKHSIGFLPEIIDIGREDITQLRKHWKEWKRIPEAKTCIILINTEKDNQSSPFTEEFAEQIQVILGSEWTVKTIPENLYGIDAYTQLIGVELCLFFTDPKQKASWAKLWALPIGSFTLEFQNEFKIDGEFQHMAAAAEFNSWIITLYKGSTQELRNQACTIFTEFLKTSYPNHMSP